MPCGDVQAQTEALKRVVQEYAQRSQRCVAGAEEIRVAADRGHVDETVIGRYVLKTRSVKHCLWAIAGDALR